MRLANSLLLTLCLLLFTAQGHASESKSPPQVSGTVIEGYRVLSLTEPQGPAEFTVYRGDYIKFTTTIRENSPRLTIAELAVDLPVTGELTTTPFIKMIKSGTYSFHHGSYQGLLHVIDYRQHSYQEVTSAEAEQLIAERAPLIVDVRTPMEHAQGRIPGSLLIPVQELQSRHGELAAYRDTPVLLYCATGNRSTVAAKVLIDNGHRQIYNLREGYHVWAGQGKAVELN